MLFNYYFVLCSTNICNLLFCEAPRIFEKKSCENYIEKKTFIAVIICNTFSSLSKMSLLIEYSVL